MNLKLILLAIFLALCVFGATNVDAVDPRHPSAERLREMRERLRNERPNRENFKKPSENNNMDPEKMIRDLRDRRIKKQQI